MIKCTLQYFLEIKSNVGFRGEGKTGVPGEKPLVASREPPNSGIEPGPHWWEANALTLRQPCSTSYTRNVTDIVFKASVNS